MEKGENDVFPFPSKGNQTWNIPKATKFEAFQRPLNLDTSIGHQVRCFPIDLQTLDHFKATKHGTFQRPSNLEPSISHQVRVFPYFLPSPSL
jgi:hypothetical protein